MKFTKPPLTHEQQLDQLIRRGMICLNRAEALHYLGHINYYRLAAYWLPFEADHVSHTFQPGTRFEDVMNLYVFDRELRLLVLDAIEHVEISVRTGWVYCLAHSYGHDAHMKADLFKKPTKNWDYMQQREKLGEEARKSKETFLQHHYRKYDETMPPLWAIVEIMTMGQLSRWYSNLRHGADRNAVSARYDMDETNFTSFLHHLSVIRNFCAHHSRLWNREFAVIIKLPSHRPPRLTASLNHQNSRRLYNTLTILAWLLDCINPEHCWKLRLKKLLAQHGIDLEQMGFPANWERMAVWK